MEEQGIDRVVLGMLREAPGPWAMFELERAFGHAVRAQDAVSRLVAGGMAHRIEGDFVFASAAGRYALDLDRSSWS